MYLPLGLTGRSVLTVTDADTAAAVGSGDVPVLATPRLLALAEAATVDAIREALPAELTTVGVRVEVAHQLPTPVGATATATATLDTVDGRALRFTVVVRDDVESDDPGDSGTGDGRIVAEAVVERAAIDRARFLARLDPRGTTNEGAR
ncbi:thioesterase family protein [Cryptosporangium minutisporangium]|uniref:Fluoroacetyl-CoA-specific thioesterase-like domain-containing protein n=1 Tax=Cryptosporangium minutisporangium TaxID=113569 RepID=A0ABP6SQS0_9ACTN